MIVRSNIDPGNFDYFNDYRDTRSYLLRELVIEVRANGTTRKFYRIRECMENLAIGFGKYLERESNERTNRRRNSSASSKAQPS